MAYTPRGPTGAGRGTGRTVSAQSTGWSAHPGTAVDGGVRRTPTRRRREAPYLVLGVALVVAGALTAMVLWSRSSARLSVLVLARDVPVGQPLTTADLRVEQLALRGASVPVVREADAASVLGQVAAVPLRAGRLLAAEDVGAPGWPPDGQVLIAVALPPGTYPPELAPGMHVLAGTGTPDGAAAVASAISAQVGTADGLADAPEAVVAAVRDNPAGTGAVVVSLLLTSDGAGRVTAVPASQLRLVVVPAPAPAPSTSAPATAGGG